MFLFYIISCCPQLFYSSPLPYHWHGVLKYACCVNKLCQNVGCKPEYDVILWRHKRLISSNNDHHMPLLNIVEFARGHPIKQSPRASPDLCTPLSHLQHRDRHRTSNTLKYNILLTGFLECEATIWKQSWYFLQSFGTVGFKVLWLFDKKFFVKAVALHCPLLKNC